MRRLVVHKYDASSLHDDFRLEVGGVHKSWAVPRGPSTDPSENRMAIRTLDHPRTCADFGGVIPDDEDGDDEATLGSVHSRLEKLERESCPFEDRGRESAVHWAKPELVAEFGFTEWTSEGRLRHSRYVGLREDKPARQVRRGRP